MTRSGLSWLKSFQDFFNGNCVKVADLSGGGIGALDSPDAKSTLSVSSGMNGTYFWAVFATENSEASCGSKPLRN